MLAILIEKLFIIMNKNLKVTRFPLKLAKTNLQKYALRSF